MRKPSPEVISAAALGAFLGVITGTALEMRDAYFYDISTPEPFYRMVLEAAGYAVLSALTFGLISMAFSRIMRTKQRARSRQLAKKRPLASGPKSSRD